MKAPLPRRHEITSSADAAQPSSAAFAAHRRHRARNMRNINDVHPAKVALDSKHWSDEMVASPA
eukprot:CAMPEP_0171799970 /NCGR_PEP_ID=MMETSP0991-20121206/71396_1 /TAXON_ID=483369 /ORGANISM="non described non described, Strain CCMP2098" /LENGTH=63 /DNA_ID=CAMNT_0012411381 /DNA_START=96 /DNA_END=287 /DNA_ORIENTATION=+